MVLVYLLCVDSALLMVLHKHLAKYQQCDIYKKIVPPKNQKLQEKQHLLLSAEEDVSKMRERVTEMESLKDQLRSQGLALERMEAERLELSQKLEENCEKLKSLTKERNDLKELQESFERERRQLAEYAREIKATVSNAVAFSLSAKCFFGNLVSWKKGGSVEQGL